jgi:hypothetical protein
MAEALALMQAPTSSALMGNEIKQKPPLTYIPAAYGSNNHHDKHRAGRSTRQGMVGGQLQHTNCLKNQHNKHCHADTQHNKHSPKFLCKQSTVTPAPVKRLLTRAGGLLLPLLPAACTGCCWLSSQGQLLQSHGLLAYCHSCCCRFSFHLML